MLTTTETLTAVAGLIRKYGIEKLVVDPVMAAKGGEALIKGEVKKTLIRELIPLCFIVTPNIPEAEILAEIKISDIHDMESAQSGDSLQICLNSRAAAGIRSGN
jgi:hydroxymethylpyrimidine/phosphomethylpyrimidine kinase